MTESNEYTGFEIAVIGMAGRFPGATNIGSLWENIKNGEEGITFFSYEEVLASGVSPEVASQPNYVRAAGVMSGKEYFDSSFFGYLPGEARVMDPQVRIFHECAWEALEDAAYNPENFKGLIGLYAGGGMGFHWQLYTTILENIEKSQVDSFLASQLRNKDFLTTMIAYKLNLRGPVLSVYSSCSTSLAAIHVGCQALLSGECDMVVAGGVSIIYQSSKGYFYKEGMIVSPDGHCKAFDKDAQGTVGGEGAGVVVLKPLDSALNDRDHIYAIIKATFINNDGWRKVGFTAPSVEGQAEAIRHALSTANVPPESIGYIETHGTGTALGDPVEIEALRHVFGNGPAKTCALGAIKTNIGHLDSAAGVAGFIKAVLTIKNREIPPSFYFKAPNPRLDLEHSPFYINTGLVKWQNDQYPLRAGVSSFGIGGTNGHVILEEAPAIPSSTPGREYKIMLLSARTDSALERMTQNLVTWLSNHRETNLADAAFTLQTGRKVFPHRRMWVCRDGSEAMDILSSRSAGRVKTLVNRTGKDSHTIVFMFPGQGAQYVNMCHELYEGEALFREILDESFRTVNVLMGENLKEVLYPGEVNEGASERVKRTGYTQPLLFIIEYALARLLMSWGIEPDVMIGHSIGEYTAACLSGVFSLDDALQLVVMRGRLMQEMPGGSMMSVSLPEGEVRAVLRNFPSLSLAAINAPGLCVVSGPTGDIERLETALKNGGTGCRRLHTSHAFHSGMMDPILPRFEEVLNGIDYHEPKIPFISNTTGQVAEKTMVMGPEYWSNHLRDCVYFSTGIETLLNYKTPLFIEVGPGKTLSSFIHRHPGAEAPQKVRTVNLVRHLHESIPDLRYLLECLGELWLYGVNLDWQSFYKGEQRYRVSMPGYSFEKVVYPVEVDPVGLLSDLFNLPDMGRKPAIEDWFYTYSWRRSLLLPGEGVEGNGNWLVFMDESGRGMQLLERVHRQAGQVITVRPGQVFSSGSRQGEYRINPEQEGDYELLFKELSGSNWLPGRIIHLWGLGHECDELTGDNLEKMQLLGYHSLLSIARTIGRLMAKERVEVVVITEGIQEVTGTEVLAPAKSTVLGALGVMAQEYKNIRCRSVDVVIPGEGEAGEDCWEQLYRELTYGFDEPVIAYRGRHRWVRYVERVRLPGPAVRPGCLKRGGVYLITGGLGGIGRVLAGYLARELKPVLIITGRTPLPGRQDWEQWLRGHGDGDKTGAAVRYLLELEKEGARVYYLQGDIADKDAMERGLAGIEAHTGRIIGIIHAAGIADYGGVIQERRREDDDMVMWPKIKGTLVLNDLANRGGIEFFVLCSSLASVAAPFGQVAYCAANIFLHAFATYRHRMVKGGGLTLSIGWDTWQEVGMAVEAVKRSYSPGADQALAHGIRSSEGIEVFLRSLVHGIPSVDISTRDIQLIMAGPAVGKTDDGVADLEKESVETPVMTGERPELTTTYKEATSPMEKKLVKLWEEFFGIRPVGVDDHFFELGGDSLKATTISGKIKRELAVDIPLAEFFSRPTIAELAQRIEGIVNESASNKSESSVIPLAEEREYYPLSPAQKRLYFFWQMDTGSTVYNMWDTVFLGKEAEGEKERLQELMGDLVRRHESFRTSFVVLGEEVVQRVHTGVSFDIKTVEMVDPGVVEAFNPFHYVRPFNLEQAPLLRVTIFRLGGKGSVLLLDMHHIIADGVSVAILQKEFSLLSSGKTLPVLNRRYRDYVCWLKGEGRQGLIEKQGSFWLSQFAGEVPILGLPVDYARPAVQNFSGAVLQFYISPGEVSALKSFARGHGVTVFMSLFSLLAVWLSRLSGQEDMVIGTGSAGRGQADLEGMIGMFVNTLAIRMRPEKEKTFLAFLQEVKETTLGAFENQDYPFEELVEKVELHRDAGRNPLFDIMFNYLGMFEGEGKVGESGEADWGKIEYNPVGVAKFDLTMTGIEMGEVISIMVEYSSRLFKREMVERWLGYWQYMVQEVLRLPGQELGAIELVPAEEKERLLHFWNETGTGFPRDKSLGELFREQVERGPGRAAVVLAGEVLSYEEVDEASARLARYLSGECGVEIGEPVVLLSDRSPVLIISILGILKARGAYLPVSPAFPDERMRIMIDDSSSRVMVVHGAYEERVERLRQACKTLTKVLTINHGRDIQGLGEWSRDKHGYGERGVEGKETGGDSLAYIIYTSGSTGIPKGTLTTHRSVVRVVKDTNYIGLDERDRVLQLSDYAFDGSVFDIFGALLNGAVLVLVKGEESSSVEALSGVLKREQVTVFFVTTALFNTLVDIGLDGLSGVRRVLFGGERVSVEHTRRAWQFLGDDRIIHVYGPTETTVFATYYPVPGSGANVVTIPIGLPLANTVVYILDWRLQAVPIGLVGEIYIGGDGVSPGYLNNIALTHERFIPDPYRPGGKMYWSGDLGRRLENGSIEFNGRIDHQVKVRGYRIECGEIEARLRGYPGISQCLVMACEDETGSRFLCAYLVGEEKLDMSGLKAFAGQELPSYMVPAYFVLLKELPLKSTGKVDSSRLPDPREKAGEGVVLPRDEVEKRLAVIWGEVLGIAMERIGIESSFFDLGGHSLKATVLSSRVHREWDIKFPLAEVFSHPTIREQAQWLQQAAKDIYIGVEPAEEKEYYRLSYNQKRLWFIDQLEHGNPFFNISDTFALEGDFNEENTRRILSLLIQRHEAFRTGFSQVDEEPIQWILPKVEVPLSWNNLSHLPVAERHGERERIIGGAVATIFELDTPPLLRVVVVQTDKQRIDIVFVVHHIISDGWSVEVLKKEFAELYEAEKSGQIPALTGPLFLQYRDFAEWQNRLLHVPGQKERLVRYWQERIGEKLPLVQLPRDFVETHPGKESAGLRFVITGKILERYKQIAKETNTGLFSLLLAPLCLTLGKVCQQQDIVFAVLGAGRSDILLEGVIGFFVNTLLFRSRIDEDVAFGDYLEALHRDLMEMLEHQGYPLELVFEEMGKPFPEIPLMYDLVHLSGREAVDEGLASFELASTGPVPDVKFGVAIKVFEFSNRVDVHWHYRTHWFKRQSIEYMMGIYTRVLSRLVEEPGLAVKHLLVEKKKKRLVLERES